MSAVAAILIALSTGHAIRSPSGHVGVRLALLGSGDEVGLGLTVQVTGWAFTL